MTQMQQKASMWAIATMASLAKCASHVPEKCKPAPLAQETAIATTATPEAALAHAMKGGWANIANRMTATPR